MPQGSEPVPSRWVTGIERRRPLVGAALTAARRLLAVSKIGHKSKAQGTRLESTGQHMPFKCPSGNGRRERARSSGLSCS